MSDEAQRWKEKYLKSIDQQDKLERRWNARLDLLRHGLVRSSLAAEGADKAVDQCMKEMREIVRKDDMDAGLAALIPRLEKAVLDSEQRREQRVEQMGAALTSLVTQLQALPLPKEVSRQLKRLAKGLDERINQARELPLLLDELSGLQGQALALMERPELAARPGFLQRLFGGREADPQDAPLETAALPQWTNEAPVQAQPAPRVAAEVEPQTVVSVEPQTIEDNTQSIPARVDTEANISPADEVPLAPLDAKAQEALESDPIPMPAADEAQQPQHRVDVPDSADQAGGIDVVGDVTDGVDPVAVDDAPVAVADQLSDEPAADSAPVELTQGQTDNLDDAESEAEAEVAGAEEDGPYALPSSPEPTYSSVATHIEQTLLGLLDELSLPEHHRPQAEAMRVRLENGLNWYELLPILDDLAVLMLAITDSGQHEFEIYLKQLNDRLESFQSNLQAASADHADTQSASRQLNDQLREHVGGLQSSVQDAADLNSLKTILESRLERLIGAMDQHQQERDEREHEVASKLQSLVGRVATMEQEAQSFRTHLEEQRQKALIDTLTGLPNRAAWSERLEIEITQLQKSRGSLLMGILDLDHFKRINDGYGHLAGDKVLKLIASQLRRQLRPHDFIARYGGEEFVFLLPHTSMEDGLALLERLRATIEQCPFHFKGEPVTITVSMGISTFKLGERSDLVLKRADEALYRAKGEGRNRIEQG
ncbi:GGDEF domain-containing protein [Pseudomonas huanghezhanensis]|uniref:GGDEF domain-containing protein n=1 Tax=Pseudomonas huanghezhanensis TaxID=3002903 RepID=UPI00228635CA|nr:diguanylate cyclase [Pseudomonas sp. BSw22131]